MVPGQEEGPTGLVYTELQHLGGRGMKHGSGIIDFAWYWQIIFKLFPAKSVMYAGKLLKIMSSEDALLNSAQILGIPDWLDFILP